MALYLVDSALLTGNITGIADLGFNAQGHGSTHILPAANHLGQQLIVYAGPLEQLRRHPDIRVALLDVMLPDIDGFEVCRNIRATDKKIGIIMLTARSQEMDKITGLMTGADDYVTKPFSPAELLARVESILRRAGKTHNNFYKLYDAAMLSFTSYTKAGLRLATFFGAFCGGVSFIVAVIYLIMKLLYWDRFMAGMAPLLIGMCFLGSVQIFFIGLLGEYIMSINTRVMHRPLVVEEERINFDTPAGAQEEV